ncbi:MAG: RNA methyltransferase [Lachnospiraceae bacterium]|nr:RNA methyltransferase [Lachnospiraceae bacterium]
MITSLSNGRIRHLCELISKSRLRNEERLFVCEGFRMFEEAPDKLIKEVYTDENTYVEMEECFLKTPSSRLGRAFLRIKELSKKGVFVETVSENVLKKIADTKTPQGIVFALSFPEYNIEDLGEGNILVLENIQDPGNLGTMIRTAEGAGAGGILMTDGTVDIFNPKTVRSTMGSLFRVPFIRGGRIGDVAKTLKENGIKIYAACLDGERYYDEVPYETRCAFMIGNEGNGLSQEAVEQADELIKIPMEGKLESLNAAVSAAILLYNARKG